MDPIGKQWHFNKYYVEWAENKTLPGSKATSEMDTLITDPFAGLKLSDLHFRESAEAHGSKKLVHEWLIFDCEMQVKINLIPWMLWVKINQI